VLSKLSHTSTDINSIATCVDQTPLIPARTQICISNRVDQAAQIAASPHYLNLFWPKPLHAREDTKFISTSLEQANSMLASSQNLSQHLLIKPTHSSDNTRCISTCVDQSPPMPSMIQKVSQHVLTKPCHASTD
jgi:hypothetical protein